MGGFHTLWKTNACIEEFLRNKWLEKVKNKSKIIFSTATLDLSLHLWCYFAYIVVVLPAPLCPRNDVIWFSYKFKLNRLTATLPDLYTCKTSIIQDGAKITDKRLLIFTSILFDENKNWIVRRKLILTFPPWNGTSYILNTLRIPLVTVILISE